MPEIIDDKSEHCIPFIIDHIKQHRQRYETKGETPPPFFVGLNGVQGAGKTTLVTALSRTLSSAPHKLPVLVLSIDDLYLPHTAQVHLATALWNNPLVQHRGQPSTHDINLGYQLFYSLANRHTNIKIPSYDKSAFSGAGDRLPEDLWAVVNRPGEPTVDVVVFEGWCVGFRPLPDEGLERKWEAAARKFQQEPAKYQGQLGRLNLESVQHVNTSLRSYDRLTDMFGAFVHIDAEDTQYVYTWRREQEAALRAEKGTGMSDEQVVIFVNGYYPAYELYTDVLRKGIFGGETGKQLRLVVGRDRKVKEVLRI
ncbi:hypothetical protein LTR62_002991 [Meristemomyces frigidus]|uniref:P-loop containing nucleoside triphosphate hydrolase protein n=1 Tax=Meristemomyces frigidus TaxID=1508187 RepID=A0AAN7YNI9_9PEZI|nr:hypothetical protein LTR62_002991 [Meristemomyces frigidus]